MAEGDEIGEELDRVLRVTLTAAGQVGEAAARRNADRQREAASASQEQAAAMQREMAAQRDGARVVSRQAADSRFWDSASARDVGQVWEAARSWSEQDPQAAAAADLVRSGVVRKWGIDVDALTATGAGRSPRDQASDLVNAIADQAAARHERLDSALDRAGVPAVAADGAAATPGERGAAGDATRELLEAELDRQAAGRLERDGQAQDSTAGPGAGADERNLAGRLREVADVHDVRAAADLDWGADRQPAGIGRGAG